LFRCYSLILGSPFGAGRDSVVCVATRLRAGRLGVRTPVGARDFLFFRLLPDRLFGPPSVLYNGCQCFFPVVKRQGHSLTTHPQLAPSLSMSRDIILFPLRAFARVRWILLLLTFTRSVCHCLTEVPLEMQKKKCPFPQSYLRFEIVMVETGSSLSMDAACSSKRPYISISNCTFLQLIRMQYRSLVLTNK